MSMVMTCGRSFELWATASRPSRASPTISKPPSEPRMPSSTLRMKAESSATSTRIFSLVTIVRLSPGNLNLLLPDRRLLNRLLNHLLTRHLLDHRSSRRTRLSRGPNQLDDLRDECLFLHRLDHECCGAFL